jgi:parvulin-like peptidyl-prolyl isomerase
VVARLDSVRANCKEKERFVDAVRRLSSDGQSKSRGGDLGWTSVYQLNSAIAKAIDSLDVGGVSEPVRIDNTYAVFRLDQRVESRPYTLEDDWDLLAEKAKDILAQKRLFDLVRTWRAQEYVDIRQ